jgi:hypothetical protein
VLPTQIEHHWRDIAATCGRIQRRYWILPSPSKLSPYQRVAKRSEMHWLRPELCVLATRMAKDRLEHFALVEHTNNGSDHVHQFEVLPFHVAPEQALRIRGEFKKTGGKIGQRAGRARSRRMIV